MEILLGKNIYSFFRDFTKQAIEDASRLRFVTEVTISEEKETEATVTTDGVVNTITDGENTADFTSLAYVENEETLATWEELYKMFKANKLVEFWRVRVINAEEGTVKATYYQGYFTSFEISQPADGKVELSFSFAINGNGVDGNDVLSEEQKRLVVSAQYEYEKLARKDSE